MISNARGSHSSPGIYSKEVDLSYAAKSLGITTLGVVGETLKGPAFEPIKINNWREFQTYFGGTSAEKFIGSEYPKYELPYIAKSYLKNSNQLEVCRVLGLSGYNAGPAWVITASPASGETKYAIAVLRSRGGYDEYGSEYNVCEGGGDYDTLKYYAKSVSITGYTANFKLNGCTTGSTTKLSTALSSGNYGRFTIEVTLNNSTTKKYAVSLNPSDKDYIINVLGSTNQDGDAAVFVEELYDVALSNMVKKGSVSKIDVGAATALTGGTDENYKPIFPKLERVLGIIEPTELPSFTVKNVGQRYIVKEEVDKKFKVKVVAMSEENGVRSYALTETDEELSDKEVIYVVAEGCYYENNDGTLKPYENDVNDYKEAFRCATTPWVVSELKGDDTSIMIRKLFRFHTISDGDTANSEVKVSIQNIRPDEGLFDVIVRKFDDIDSSPSILERYSKCSMVPGTANFIGLKIGTFDGEYELNSKYIAVEVNANELTETCVPCGFLGYPMRSFGSKISKPDMGYNIYVDEDINAKKQYFGFSNLVGVDIDLFKYKGRAAYDNEKTLSAGFHLDSRITPTNVSVDGKTGFEFKTVDIGNLASINGGIQPLIGTENEMSGTIYENINLRKFTVCFYGGFDGWDIYRDSRTNTDKYKANKYKGEITKGNGSVFSQIYDTEGLNLTGRCITSDYYAYLAGIRQFMNPEAVDINVFATPGIDYVNNTLLVSEALTMIEEDRGDALYIMTTPDKPFGSSDNDIYYPEEVVENFYNSEIDSSYAATYYPWVKYYDDDNKVYINLPATKDVVRSLAYTDNISYPWFAPAGIIRGGVECEKAHFITKLEDEDILYEGSINPIKTFATDGVKIWGQKTMYSEDTPLNRINIRRLMLRVKKLITGACRRLIFEQNDATVKTQFEGLVKPILDDIKAKRGIFDYRLEVDDSAEARDRMELPAVIYIKPVKTLEYISLTFVITPEAAKFDDI